MTKSIQKILKQEWLFVGILIVIALFLRFWRLKYPGEIVFDETYYVNFAQNYLRGQSFFDVHPPLGKLLIALGIKLFGFNAWGWRFMPALFGTLLVPIVYLLSKKIFQNSLIALAAAFFLVFDGLFLVQSRIASLDTFLIFFVLLSFLFLTNFLEKRKTIYLFISSIFLGLSLATKWTAAPFTIIFLIYLASVIKKKSNLLVLGVVFLLALPGIIYLTFFLFDNHHSYKSFFDYLYWWHSQALGFHLNLKDSHPYQSRWYSWLLLIRPVWYHYKDIGDKIIGIIALGNPLIWWPAIIALFYGFWELLKKKRIVLFMPLASFLVFYLGWAFVKRVQFQYYILPALPFYFMVLAYFWKKVFDFNKKLAIFWLVLVVLAFFFFYPLLTAWPIPTPYYQIHIWFSSWI